MGNISHISIVVIQVLGASSLEEATPNHDLKWSKLNSMKIDVNGSKSIGIVNSDYTNNFMRQDVDFKLSLVHAYFIVENYECMIILGEVLGILV